ncbi:OB-fold-containig protein [Alkanindiges sp. WGS2144]|uniref:OB-fold-containig protein n=1 Tax=Alkanindiges sp. WGS2144 TaxID=3366808 RepID=UPI003753DEE5
MTGSWLFSAPFWLFTLSLMITLILTITGTLGATLKLHPSAWLIARLPRFLEQQLIQSGIQYFPIFTLGILFLLNFGLLGYALQFIWFAFKHHFAPVWFLVIPALLFALLFTVFLSRWLSHFIDIPFEAAPDTPPDLLGRVATICRGNARPGLSAQARVRDQLGQLHYIEVEPEFGELELNSEVILIARHQRLYVAKTLPKDNHLLDQ